MPNYLSYKRQIAVLDADDVQWITVKGNHIPIKEGQSKEDAVKSFFESKKGNSNNTNKESKYSPEFEIVRKNALAKGNVYGGKYTQKSKAEAYKEYKNDTSSKENMKKANEFVNGKPESSVKLSKGMTLKFSDGSKQTIKSIRSDLIDTEKSTHTAEKLIAGIKKGDIKIETKESSKKWSGAWSKRANKPVALGEAVKSAAQTSYSLNKKAKQEANYTALEIAYNDVAFTKSPKQNKADMLKAVSNSGAENIDYMKQTISNMPETAFESHNSFRKGLKDTSKWHSDWFKRANKPVTLGTALKSATNIMKKTKELGKLDKKA